MKTNFLNVSSQGMAPKKLLSKKARKDAVGEGSSAAPQVDVEFGGHRFEVRNTSAVLRQLRVGHSLRKDGSS